MDGHIATAAIEKSWSLHTTPTWSGTKLDTDVDEKRPRMTDYRTLIVNAARLLSVCEFSEPVDIQQRDEIMDAAEELEKRDE